MGCDIAPSNASTIEDFVEAIRDRPYGSELLVDGDLNANLEDPEGKPRSEAIVEKLTVDGLMDMGMHLLPWRKPWFGELAGFSGTDDRSGTRWTTFLKQIIDFFRMWLSSTRDTT